MKNLTKRPNKNGGFTLLELVIGIALSVIVLGGLLAVYIPTIQSWNSSASLAQIHDTESVAHDLFGTGIRQAGLLACGRNFNILDGIGVNSSDRGATANWAFNSSEFLKTSFKAFAADASVTSTLDQTVQDQRLTAGGSVIGDAFFVLAPSRGFYRVDAHSASGNDKVLTLSSRLTSSIQFSAGEYFIINDCNNPVLIRATAADTSTYDSVTKKATISLSYSNTLLNGVLHPVNTVINVFEPAIYYLRDKSGVPTLYKATIGVATPLTLVHTPILPGVENMRVEYGIADTNGDYVDKYETIKGPSGGGNSATATLDNVLAVRISLMIQAPGGNATQSSMSFPNLKGVNRDCFKAGEASEDGFADACPAFVISAEGRRKTHKVITFTYILPRVVSI